MILIVCVIFIGLLLKIGWSEGIVFINMISNVLNKKSEIDIFVVLFILIFVEFVVELKVFVYFGFFKWCWYFGLFLSFLFILFINMYVNKIFVRVDGIVIINILFKWMFCGLRNVIIVIMVVVIGFVIMVNWEVIIVIERGCFGWMLLWWFILVIIGRIEYVICFVLVNIVNVYVISGVINVICFGLCCKMLVVILII